MPRLLRLKQPTEFTWKRYSGTLGVVHLTDDRDTGGIIDGRVVSLCHRRGSYAGHDTRPRRIVQQWSKLGGIYEGVEDSISWHAPEVIWRPPARLHRCGTCQKIAYGSRVKKPINLRLSALDATSLLNLIREPDAMQHTPDMVKVAVEVGQLLESALDTHERRKA